MFLSAVKGVLLTLKNCNTSHRHIWDTKMTQIKLLLQEKNDLKKGQQI